MKAVRIHSFGGPEVLKFEEAPTPELNPDEVLIKADEVIDYKNEKFEERLQNLDLVFDTLGGEIQKRSFRVLKNGGRLITTVRPEPDEVSNAKNILVEGFMALSVPEDLEQIAGLIDQGKIKPVVSQIMPLDKAAEAQKLSEQGHVTGKIVLQVLKESSAIPQ